MNVHDVLTRLLTGGLVAAAVVTVLAAARPAYTQDREPSLTARSLRGGIVRLHGPQGGRTCTLCAGRAERAAEAPVGWMTDADEQATGS